MLRPTHVIHRLFISGGVNQPRPVSLFLCLSLFLLLLLHLVDGCPDQCDCFNYDDTVDCSHRGLDQLPSMSNVTRRLYLEDNRLAELPKEAFRTAASLSLLVLERNELTGLSTHSFCGLPRLQELDLGGNRIRMFSVDPESNCRTPDLKEINLSLNLLKTIPRNLSCFAPFLEILNLSYNEIESAALDASYADMVALRHLDLSRNRIHEIFSEDFAALRGIPLEILNLAECGLVSVDDDAFRSIGNLSSLMLSNNLMDFENLERVLQVGFPPSGNLVTHLDLSEIILPNLTVSMLGSFSQLIILDASFCDVEFVESRLFDRLSNLKTLHLEFGKLVQLENLSALKKLQRLYLQENRLTSVEIGDIFTLESIDLSYNKINYIPTFWLNGLRNLQILNLSHNQITAVESNALKQVAIISTLDLSFNRIQVLKAFGLVRLARLDVSHNVLEVIEDGVFENLHQTLNEVDLSHNNLTRICGPVFRRSHNVQTLRLAGNNLGEFIRNGDALEEEEDDASSAGNNNNPFESLQLLKTLDLSINRITVLGCEHLSSLHNLETLYLQNNNLRDLRSVDLGCVKTTLTKVVLSGNQLRRVDVDLLTELGSLEELDLSDNPFDCNCSLVAFVRWSNYTTVKITRQADSDRYQCGSSPDSLPRKPIFSYGALPSDCPPTKQSFVRGETEGEEMEGSRYLIILALTTLAGMAIGIVFMIVFCRYRCGCHPIKTLNYHWQIRYQEVADVETSVDVKM